MDRLKGYMEKLKTSASQLVAERKDVEPGTAVELDEKVYDTLKRRAEHQHMTVEALADRAIRQFLAAQAAETSVQLSVERKENNPLLYLDGITRSIV